MQEDKSERKPRRHAAALKYDPLADEAPILAAVGKGVVAEHIIETAKEHGVPVVEDSSAAELLAHFSVGDAIPPALYEVVAQILLFVAEMDTKAGEKLRHISR
ncbi:MAG: EscU/YscU/HrcU family type III secretion system export apparatus switch protein [Candidatus Pelethousia sp.]|nr:EscU/YscU/HrcU family type III secretion system export apparatus switch protein [Candidatus Pelethousia sp.]